MTTLEKDESEKTRRIKQKDYIDTLEEEFQWEFLQHPDLKAAYATGLFYNRIANEQSKTLKTRGLQKKMRYLFDRLTKESLLKIMDECIKVSFSVQTKNQKDDLPFPLIRSKVEELFGFFQNEAKEEELSLAFMMGYDNPRRTWQKFDSE